MLFLWACQAPLDGALSPHVVVNEVVARNESTWDDGTSRFPDWVELFNAGSVDVPIADLAVTDGDRTWHGKDGTLRPGERLLIVADGVDTPFEIGGTEAITVLLDGVPADRVQLDDPAPDVAWARHPDGGDWAPTTWATPEAPNPDEPSPTLDPSDDAFGTRIHDMEIVLDAEAMDALSADRFEWVQGVVQIGELRYAPVEIRLKSLNGSRRELDQKPGFKIDLDGGLRWKGLTSLTLNNMVQDPTYLREHLAYMLYRESGVPAPRVAWVHLRVNGVDHGLSLLVESADEAFLSRWYEDPTGALYEGSAGVDLVQGDVWRFEYDQGPDPDDRSDLSALVAALDAPPDDAGIANLEALVNLDEVITHLAVESVALHWDGYRNANNYRLYHDPVSDRFELLPWGADEAFDRVLYDPWSGGGRLAIFCLSNAGCRARYEAALVEAANRADALGLTDEALGVEAWLRPAIEVDPKKEFDMARHDEEMNATLQLLASWPGQVRGMVEETP